MIGPNAIRHHPAVKRAADLALRVIPVAGLISIAAYVAAQQAINPQRRVIKLGILLGLMALMLRFDMVYSVYLFTILFPFPSGVSIGSTNSILMTLIPLIWAVRAASTGTRYFLRRTNVDLPIALFLFAFVISFFNVESLPELRQSLKVMWRAVASVAYFFMIVWFVNDEKKIIVLTKVMCGVAGFVMLTAIVELFMPGASIIPGWISLSTKIGQGTYAYRIEGMRVGGALGSHGVLSDLGTQTLFLMIYHTMRSRNPLEKTIWGGVALTTVIAIMATANRGAMVGFLFGVFYFMILFRDRLSITKMLVIVASIGVLLMTTEFLLTRYTYAVSLTDRFITTTFEGIVPNNRVGTWAPALKASLEHPFIGHGPYFQLTGGSLRGLAWPHNGYIFYLYTIGVLGLLAFFAVVFRVWQYSLSFRLPGAKRMEIGYVSRILHVILMVMLIEQLRTDHQRDDIYPFIVWLEFGLVTATALVLREKLSRSGGQERPESAGGTGPGPAKSPGFPGRRPAIRPGRNRRGMRPRA